MESNGSDERSWLDQDGHPHSADMRLVERHRRATPDTMDVTITLTHEDFRRVQKDPAYEDFLLRADARARRRRRPVGSRR